ncbi:MAG: M48 family metallopeptidase [Caulobacterales bacterium]|nr:M48 family metallopeptidase [Caulobacterales bacterium]
MTTQTIVMSRRDIVRGLAAGTVVAIAPSCATNPETGRSQFILVSTEQLAQLSSSSWAELKQAEKVSNDRQLNAQLQRIGGRITEAAGRAGPEWEYAVFDSDAKNAFVLPGKQVGFYRGIMELADNDDQIATVLGHEVGHVTGRHAAERYSQQLAAAGITTVAAVAAASSDNKHADTWAAALGLGVQFGIILPYSRKHESEADLLGVDYMYRAGYDTREAVRFWEKMSADGGERPPEFMSTHPDPERRIRDIDQYIRNKGYA